MIDVSRPSPFFSTLPLLCTERKLNNKKRSQLWSSALLDRTGTNTWTYFLKNRGCLGMRLHKSMVIVNIEVECTPLYRWYDLNSHLVQSSDGKPGGGDLIWADREDGCVVTKHIYACTSLHGSFCMWNEEMSPDMRIYGCTAVASTIYFKGSTVLSPV